jgi:hypothetical protein
MEVSYLRWFPWLRLFRAPGAAADPKRLMLAALGLLALSLGWRGLDRLLPTAATVSPMPGVLWDWPTRPGEPVRNALARVVEPPTLVTAPFLTVFDPAADGRVFAHAALGGLWAAVVWGVFGGAIARTAAVGLATGDRVGLGESLRFALGKVGSLVGTPLIPMAGVATVGALVAGFGLLYRIPSPVGASVAGALAFLPLIGGLVLTLIVVGLAAGWPLMHASVAAEAEDGFDAMSRSYAYVHQRPWQYAAYAGLAVALGCVGYLFVDLFARLVLHLSAWSLTFAAPASTVAPLYTARSAADPNWVTASHGLWVGLVGLLVQGWVYSYFWTALTTVYLLLRRDVDGTPLTTVSYRRRPTPFDPEPAEPPADEAIPAVPAPHAAEVRDAGEVPGA